MKPENEYADRDILLDLMAAQSNMASAYNSSLLAASSDELQTEMSDLLIKEHAIYANLQKEAGKRRWLNSTEASNGLISNVKEQFNVKASS